MKKNRHNAGFTMVELLTVVAILVILMGVSAVAVIRYQRNLHLKEMDSIAKEIFVAAQNHLSAADSQNLLNGYTTNDNGSGLGYADADGNTNYIICTGRHVEGSAADNPSALEQILPFGSIDETTRGNGSFILRYNKKSARVLDVFYARPDGARFGHSLKPSDYSELLNLRQNREGRKHYSNNDTGADNAVIGWYGGDDLGTTILNYLEEPVIQVENGDQLKVTVSNFTAGSVQEGKNPQFKLIVRGLSSGSLKEFPLDLQAGATEVTKVLDDVTTSNGHFASVMKDDGATGLFYPGENIEVWALALDNGHLSNIAESGRVVVNSLFDEMKGLRVGNAASGENGDQNPTQNMAPSLTPQGPPQQHATISSFRHLLNLDSSVSGLDLDNLKKQNSLDKDDSMAAEQVSDLDWSQFMTGVKPIVQVKIYKYKGTLAVTDAGYYLPVNPSKKTSETANKDIPLQYWGNGHSIKGVSAENADGKTDAGLFQKMVASGATTSWVESLNLINFTISGTGSVGALAGTLTGSVINTAVYNDITGLTVTNDSAFAISSTGGSAGGLVGEFSGGTANGCAAAVYVSGGTSAGGLIGKVTSGTVENSYSGGHTVEGKYLTAETLDNHLAQPVTTANTNGRANVYSANGSAGGLIGILSGGVAGCYTTCSVYGATAGGFVGTASGGATGEKCYCTGLVGGTTKGVFAGSSSIDDSLKGRYLEIVNHINSKKSNGKDVPAEPADQMKEVGDAAAGSTDAPYDNASNVRPFDDSASSYNSFNGAPNTPASPYDGKLKAEDGHLSYVKAVQEGEVTTNVPQYGFKGIKVQDTDGNEVPLLHHGDWPIYETMVINS